MMKPDARPTGNTDAAGRMPYEAPRLTELGSTEKLTQWIGGPWGEFLGGTNQGWNPFQPPGDTTGS